MDDRSFEQVMQDVLALDRESQLLLADKLVSTLADDPSHDSAWRTEVRKRLDDLDRGTAKLHDVKNVLARAQQRL